MRLALHLSDVAPIQGAPVVVHEFHVDAQGGDRVAILGPSGSGKTTVLRAVIGSAASRRLAQASDTTAIDELRTGGKIGYIPQNALIFPWLSVADNIHLPYRIHNRPPENGRITELVNALKVSSFLNTKATSLSGGMAVRVVTARALVLRPHLLLIDEAFAALDEFLRYEIWCRVMQEMQSGVTMFVTHSVSDAAAFATHAIILDGRTPSRTTNVRLGPIVPSYPPVPSSAMSENIDAIRRALHS